MIEGFAVNVPFLENKAREITVGVYSLSTVEIVNSVQQIGAGFLLVARNCILGLFLVNDSIYLFDSHSKDENGIVTSSGTAVLLKFDTLDSLVNYIRSVYYNA